MKNIALEQWAHENMRGAFLLSPMAFSCYEWTFWSRSDRHTQTHSTKRFIIRNFNSDLIEFYAALFDSLPKYVCCDKLPYDIWYSMGIFSVLGVMKNWMVKYFFHFVVKIKNFALARSCGWNLNGGTFIESTSNKFFILLLNKFKVIIFNNQLP